MMIEEKGEKDEVLKRTYWLGMKNVRLGGERRKKRSAECEEVYCGYL